MKLTTRLRRTIGVLASLTLATGAIAVASPAAHADGTLSGPPTAGVSQSVTFTFTNPPSGQLQLQDQNSQPLATVSDGFGASSVNFTFTTPSVPTSPSGNLLLQVWSVDSAQFVSNQVQLQVTSVGTSTVVSAPNTAVVGKSTDITVTVTSSGGSSYAPPGQVRLTDANGAPYVTMNLTNGPGPGQSFAYYHWTPKSAGTYFFIATYIPASGSYAGASTSVQDAVIATPSGSTIAITAPPTTSLGAPINLVATVYPSSTQGSVGFTLNGKAISPAIPISGGKATFTWTPTAAGNQTLGATYTTTTGGSGSTTQAITVTAPTAADVITLVQPGWGTWSNGGSYNMGNGSNFTFQASTLSGAPVTLSENGPCAVSGLNLAVNSGSGNCTMKATSAGGNGYTGVTYTYNINLVPGQQTASVSAPVSGRYKVGRVLVLESPDQQDTNAGQNISWKVKKPGKSVCQILYPNSGSVTLKIKKKGTCTVIGSAPGVPGQWLAYQTARNYTGR